MMMPPPLVYTVDGVEYEVQDFIDEGLHLKRVPLNDRRAEFRRFCSRDPKTPDRLFPFRRMNYGRSDPEMLAQQFKAAGPVPRRND